VVKELKGPILVGFNLGSSVSSSIGRLGRGLSFKVSAIIKLSP
jgi:hypothetical protein